MVAVQHPVHLLPLRAGKGVVHGVEALRLLVPLQQRKVYHPERLEHALGDHTVFLRYVESETAELLAGCLVLAAQDQHQVPPAPTCGLAPLLEGVLIEELIDAGLHRAVFVELDVHQPPGPDLRTLDPVGECVELFARKVGPARQADAHDQLGAVEYFKAFALGYVI